MITYYVPFGRKKSICVIVDRSVPGILLQSGLNYFPIDLAQQSEFRLVLSKKGDDNPALDLDQQDSEKSSGV